MMHGTIIRVGRKRKSGKRKPSGDLSLPRDLDVVAIAVAHPDRRGLPPSQRTHQNAESPLGRLNLARVISDEQLEAGRRYARDCQRYHQVIGCPSPNAAALDMSRTGGRSVVTFSPQEITDRRETYDAAFRAVWNTGARAARAVARMAFYGETLPRGTTMDDLIRGLSALVHHYGLTTRRKSALRGK
jgi:hypothetical protein